MNIEQLVRRCVVKVKPYQPGKPIEEVKRELKLQNVYKMASNENALGPSPKALKALKTSICNIHQYPDANAFYLKKALAKKYKLFPENIIIGNGSDEIITLVLRSFINKGDEVIIAEPTFLIYKLAATLADAKVISVPLKAFRYDLPAMRKRINTKTKIIFIANPDNPTGTYVTDTEVSDFLKNIPPTVIVFFDEAYFEFAQKRDYPKTMQYIRKGNIIVSRTFSKVYGLAGLRIGWAAAGREMIGYLNQVREPFSVNSLAQIAAQAALKDQKHLQKTKQLVREQMQYLTKEFKALNLFFVPSVTNFILVNIGINTELVTKKLLSKGIIVRNMQGWGLKNFIRVTIGKPKENKLLILELRKIKGGA
ncbi:MAG: histidinol-phosphate transaminase [Candidatus Omnitrophota bacterium]|nr:MAG: histidinol-phosphate transaminase [Candidatus Omnitrophota bacterium]